MTLPSKRQQVLFAVGLLLAFSHGFVTVSNSRVPKQVLKSHFSSTKLQLSRKTQDDSSEGPLSLALLQAQDILGPAAKVLDDATDGWALGYADLSPESESTPIGQAFLASNIAYALAGLFLSIQGETILGFLLEVVSIGSFVYHYTQLQASSARDNNVRLALFIDYTLAFTSIFVGLAYLIMDQHLPPVEGLVSGGIGVACLLACWVWEQGLPYIILHSLWHFFSAYCGYIIGSTHLSG